MRIRRSRPARIVTAAAAASLLALTTAACDVGGGFSTEPRPAGGSDQGSDSTDKEKDKKGSESGRANGEASDTRAGTASESGVGNDPSGPGDKPCGSRDVSVSAKERTQAGGFVLISVKARPGVTCVLPAELPAIGFDSGTQAGPAEQSVGDPVRLSHSITAYAGLNPKTSNGDGGASFDGFDASFAKDTVHLTIPGGITVDDPIVSNWHNTEYSAVPGRGTS
ncbi:hypothetical protein [Streptomyces sp. NPDC048639]|uniref:hypothetical protein n=1 Tax=Streptomyces sp. NPDC048639 TaxID=3365581 RepID=UPI0037100A5B